jgi:Fe-S cluster biogenesis protein NfuA
VSGSNLRQTGARVEELIDGFRSAADPTAQARAEELARLLVEFYGAGLARTLEVIGEHPAGSELMGQLVDDELVGSLLVLHGLHPLGTEERIQAALEKVRPFLGLHAGDVEFLGISDEGMARLRLAGSCKGCPSSTITVRNAIEVAIQEAAPELAGIEVEGVAEEQSPSSLLQIQERPPEFLECPVPDAAEVSR